jgi:outer membrane receptor protein involved in Fe transport
MKCRLAGLALCSGLLVGSARAQEPPLPSTEYGAVATASRLPRPLGKVAASTTVLRRAEIDQNPTLGSDSLLRSVPSALTFRRSTSLTADPSSQGLNLRGVGPSGVSRTLVLVDGVPANDPFGGSIYWRALPRIGIDRVEVVPGGGSALYGSAALAGVVQLFSRPLDNRLDADLLGGSLRTLQLDARGAYTLGKLGASIEGEYLRSDGYRVVAPAQRGPVDQAADSSHLTLNARTRLQATRDLTVGASLRLFEEQQNGGTRYTTAAVRSGLLAVEAQLALAHEASLSLHVFGRLQRFEQERARIAMGRTSEALAARQDVPANDQGASLVARSPKLVLAGEHVLLAGVDLRRIEGVSRERIFPIAGSERALSTRNAGGEQLLAGAFVQDLYTVSERVELEAALRADLIRDYAGESTLGYTDGAREQARFLARSNYALSPRLGALVQASDLLTLRGSLYRAFRAPTLNELYRPFQVGTILTAANSELSPELLHGFEVGLALTPLDALVLRTTGFWSRLESPISNVTLTDPRADGAMRQRQNLGHARVRGLEASIEQRWPRSVTTIIAYTLAASEVRDGGSVAGLRGKRLAQDPVHRASLLLMFDEPRWFSAALQVRVSGAQYEDDLNTLRMKPYAVVDVSASRRLFWQLELFAAVENLLDADYLVGRAGIDTVGAPLLARAGLRLRERKN